MDPYDFIPYDYGPFDKDLYETLEYLEDQGLVRSETTLTYGGDERYDYYLTKIGKERYSENLPIEADECTSLTEEDLPDVQSEGKLRFIKLHRISKSVVEDYGDIPITNLLDMIYEEYPQYAENSVLTG